MSTTYVLQNQGFWEQALPVFAGAAAAFLFSLAAFWIRNVLSARAEKRQLLNNLGRELRYDLAVIDDISKEFTNALPKILSGDKEPYVKFKFHKVLNNFIQQAYASGMLFQMLSEYDIAVFDDVISHYLPNSNPEDWLRSRLKGLSEGALTKKDVVSTFRYEIDDLEAHKRIINDVLEKIQNFKV